MIDPADLRDVFDRAASLPPQDRAAFLARACGDNVALRQEVERLLAADARAGSVFSGDSSDGESGSEPSTSGERVGLTAGARLGPYVVLSALGAGGMGEVYKARDTRLDRSVAIKVLPSDLVASPEARQRFEREAKAAAALAHAHICRLLDVGRQGDTDYLVMELLEGETLAARLLRGRLLMRQALTFGIQIAGALAEAHRGGIVHRDLKPGNIMLTRNGAVLLDFGLARQTAPITMDAPTATLNGPITRTGVILGTIQYMAPEQLEGRAVDARTDIFAFGALLYEMVAGRRPFEGANPASVIGNILHSDPPALTTVEAMTPPALDRLVQKCLAKDPSERWQTAAELQGRLEALLEMQRDGSGSGPVSTPDTSRRSFRTTFWLSGVLVASALVAGVLWLKNSWTAVEGSDIARSLSRPQRQLTRLTFDPGLQTDPTFSPDGHFIAYASDRGGNFDIWVQPVAGGSPVQVTKSPAAETQPSWSPDGSTIAFRSERDGGGLYLIPALGGPERFLVKGGNHPSWSQDGSEIRFLADSVMMHDARMKEISAAGGDVRTFLLNFTQSPGHWFWIAPHPDGRFSFLGWDPRPEIPTTNTGRDFPSLGFYTLDSDGRVTQSEARKNLPAQLRQLLDGLWDLYGRHFSWNARGTALLLETKSENGLTNVWRVDVDPKTLEWTSFEQLTTGAGADVAATFSPDGTRIAFSTLGTSTRIWRLPFDKGGKVALPGTPVTEDQAYASNPGVSSDGEIMLFDFGRPGSLNTPHQWMKRFDTGASGPVDVDDAIAAKLSPDKRVIAFTRPVGSGWTIFSQPLGGAARQITPRRPVWQEACDWLSDGRLLVSYQNSLEAWPMNPPEPANVPEAVFRINDTGLHEARFSPDHGWLAFVAVRDIRIGAQVGITSAAGAPDRAWAPISTEFNWTDKPRWARDGKRLYFYAVEGSFLNLWAIDFDPARGVTVGQPFRVAKYESPAFRIDPEMAGTGLGISDTFALVPMRTATGNIWMLDNVDK
jgi:serine/threonine protein kinase